MTAQLEFLAVSTRNMTFHLKDEGGGRKLKSVYASSAKVTWEDLGSYIYYSKYIYICDLAVSPVFFLLAATHCDLLRP